jgi:glycosyltransferase involved in cell wall biosynthesis
MAENRKINSHNPATPSAGIKILIATGIYPPDIGGPATYVCPLTKEFKKEGVEVKIVTYSDLTSTDDGVVRISRKQNIILRYLKYFFTCLKFSKNYDIVYLLDLMSAGFPATLAAKIRGKKIVFRTGGDFLWEKAFASGWTHKSLREYYKNKKSFKEKFLIWFCSWILKKIDIVVFSTSLQRAIYLRYYRLIPDKSFIVANAIPDYSSYKSEIVSNKIIFAGRLIRLKNLNRLLDALRDVKENYTFEIYGDGPKKEETRWAIRRNNLEEKVFLMGRLSHHELLDRISKCRFIIIPSVTEISPNLALECLSMGKPLLLTKEVGIEQAVLNKVITFDPFSEDDIKSKFTLLLNDDDLFAYKKDLEAHRVLSRDWQAVAEEHLEIFKRL